MKSSIILAAAVLLGSAMAEVVAVGCYKSSTGATYESSNDFMSMGNCTNYCPGSATFATQYKKCFCGDTLPPASDFVDTSNCDINCPGYPDNNCGGKTTFFFYDTGLSNNLVKPEKPDHTTTAAPVSSTISVKASVITVEGKTIVVTSAAESSNSKPNVAGIAAGVVVGVVVIAAAMGGLFIFMRNRKRRAIEEEHRRNAVINSYTKPPLSAGSGSFQDTRLDPVMAHRRMSDGSIADNQDYSRKILKVTNA